MKKQLIAVIILIVFAVSFIACDDNNNLEKLRKNELELLDAFIDKNYKDKKAKSSGLYYFDKVIGTGDSISAGDVVQIYYATWKIDSTLVDETTGYTKGYRFEPYEFTVGAGTAISGLEEASTYMRQGAVANLVIPSELAYGQNGSSGVSGFTTLLMQVEVYKVYKARK